MLQSTYYAQNYASIISCIHDMQDLTDRFICKLDHYKIAGALQKFYHTVR